MVTLLRNAALKSLEYKSALALVRAQNIDISKFESRLLTFQTAFRRNYDLASRHFQTAVDEIDKSIDHLQKTKAALLGTDNNLRLANDKAQDVTIRKLSEMIHKEEFVAATSSSRDPGLAVGTTTAGLLSACIRLVELLSTPEDIPHLHGLIQKEIIYRVLRTPQAQRLRSIVTNGDLSARTARVMSWLRANYAKPLHMEELADVARMGVSTLHHQFRELTSMSPLQYQKQIRLQTARERMLMEGQDATTAAYGVGYESVSQFNREYSRHFGLPPMRDIKLTKERQEAVMHSH